MILIVNSKVRQYNSIHVKCDSDVRNYDSIQFFFVCINIEFLPSSELFLRKKEQQLRFFFLPTHPFPPSFALAILSPPPFFSLHSTVRALEGEEGGGRVRGTEAGLRV